MAQPQLNLFISIVVLLACLGCGKKNSSDVKPNGVPCEQGLNLERLFQTLRTLPQDRTVREVTIDYVYVTRDNKRIFKPDSFFQQESFEHYIQNHWLGRTQVVQDCSTRTVSTDGMIWDIDFTGLNEIRISMPMADSEMIFEKLSPTSFIMTQKSSSEVHKTRKFKSLIRWDLKMPKTEKIATQFIFGLNEEGFSLSERIIQSLERTGLGTPYLDVEVLDLMNLNLQL